MNSASTQLLLRLGLSQTEVFSLKEAADQDPSEKIYLRYKTNSEYKNGRVTAGEIKSNFATFVERFEMGQLLTCERCYDTIVGGISLVKPNFVFSEFVQGHSNILLRRGYWGARLLQYRKIGNDGYHVAKTFQKWHAEQRDQYVYTPIGLIDDTVIERIRDFTKVLGDISDSNLIVEWMWTTVGFFFCDAKILDDITFGDSMPKLWDYQYNIVNIRNCSHVPNESKSRKTHFDSLDCEYFPPAEDGDAIVCMNGAILAHFITRSIAKKINVKWIRPTVLELLEEY